MMRRGVAAGLVVLGVAMAAGPARGQGLVWSLPPDGTWVRYAGDYVQTDTRADVVPGTPNTEMLTWQRQLTISSVGGMQADYDGKTVPARWLEFKVVTGPVQNGMIVPGPGGQRIYKVLVPESAVIGDVRDEAGIPVSYLPVIKGYRKLGEGEAQEITSGVLQVYPLLTLLEHYEDLKKVAEGQDPGIPLGAVQATEYEGEKVFETRRMRSTNRAKLWRSPDVPFGLAKWTVTLQREVKEPSQPRSEFKETSTITETMAAQATGADAQSELPVP